MKTALLISEDPQAIQTLLLLTAHLDSPTLHWTRNLRAGLRALASEGPFVAVLLDLELGPDALRLVRARAPTTPVVALAPAREEKRGRDAVAGGALDYQVKGRLCAQALTRALSEALAAAS